MNADGFQKIKNTEVPSKTPHNTTVQLGFFIALDAALSLGRDLAHVVQYWPLIILAQWPHPSQSGLLITGSHLHAVIKLLFLKKSGHLLFHPPPPCSQNVLFRQHAPLAHFVGAYRPSCPPYGRMPEK